MNATSLSQTCTSYKSPGGICTIPGRHPKVLNQLQQKDLGVRFINKHPRRFFRAGKFGKYLIIPTQNYNWGFLQRPKPAPPKFEGLRPKVTHNNWLLAEAGLKPGSRTPTRGSLLGALSRGPQTWARSAGDETAQEGQEATASGTDRPGSATHTGFPGGKPAIVLREAAMATFSSRHRTVARKLEDLRTRESQEGSVRGGWVPGHPHKAHLPPGTRSPASPLPSARQHKPLARRRRVRQRGEGGSGCDALSVLPSRRRRRRARFQDGGGGVRRVRPGGLEVPTAAVPAW